jgi:hypothetical protein
VSRSFDLHKVEPKELARVVLESIHTHLRIEQQERLVGEVGLEKCGVIPRRSGLLRGLSSCISINLWRLVKFRTAEWSVSRRTNGRRKEPV